MSFVPGRQQVGHSGWSGWCETNKEAADGRLKNGPVKALQGPSGGFKPLRRDTVCAACRKTIPEGSAWRYRRVGINNKVCHVSCPRVAPA